MAFLRDIAVLFQDKKILVDIDLQLLVHVKSEDKVTTQRIISFNLYRLIYHIGTVQSRRFATSNRFKFLDKVDLIEKIYTNTNEFRIKIDEIKQANGSEILGSISEDFGIGISVVIAENLFNTKRSTIQKIYGNGTRPDWKCQLSDNTVLVTEGKGSISDTTSHAQEARALEQKATEPGDIRVASLTVLNENTISTTRYLDPPTEGDNISSVMQNHIFRAGHYASIFSFLGNSRLSRYYSQMRKRLEGIITSQEQTLKDLTFRDILFNYPTITFKTQDFAGSFYEIEAGKYIFAGVDKRLLSYQGFISYKEFDEDIEEILHENVFILFKDGVLVIEIKNIDNFSNIIDIHEIKNYQDNITISDIDEMNEISFSKYFEYVLQENGFSNFQKQTIANQLSVDLTASKGNEIFYFELKILKTKQIGGDVFQQLSRIQRQYDRGKIILVTNSIFDLPTNEIDNIRIIDREKLDKITKDINILSEYIA